MKRMIAIGCVLFASSQLGYADEDETAASCRVPNSLDGKKVVYYVLATVNNPASDFFLTSGLVYTGRYAQDTFTFVEADSPGQVSSGEYTYQVSQNIGIIRGEFVSNQPPQTVPFSLTLTCRTNRSGIYSYSARDREQAPATMGRYTLQ